MAVWIKLLDDVNSPHRLAIVSRLEEATPLSNANAQQVSRDAALEYPSYRWKERSYGSYFVAEGSSK